MESYSSRSEQRSAGFGKLGSGDLCLAWRFHKRSIRIWFPGCLPTCCRSQTFGNRAILPGKLGDPLTLAAQCVGKPGYRRLARLIKWSNWDRHALRSTRSLQSDTGRPHLSGSVRVCPSDRKNQINPNRFMLFASGSCLEILST